MPVVKAIAEGGNYPRSSPPPVTDISSLRPTSATRIPSNPMGLMSPTDLVGPSPVTSNGTETTEIEDDASEEVRAQSTTYEEAAPRVEVLISSW